ncbi:hypothetical protein TRICHSKD4_5400 [Roseibium sp. TrichSKD4]|nr:hypothetical protein TRICHSKD4_5400 [Roseibium sp. TrichSKD4]
MVIEMMFQVAIIMALLMDRFSFYRQGPFFLRRRETGQ